ncbi:MAG: VOC family protein [Candidatus Omnitrophica bacterium]|nr:VOC family protein [Candidatus Omnitrophota bacterium]
MKFHHVGIACKDLDAVKAWVKSTHPIEEEIGPVFDELQKASFITLRTKDGFLIELICGQQVSNILARGVNLYHVCYTVADLDKTIHDFKKRGAVVISAAKPSTLFKGKRIAFLNTPIGIIELLEE